MKGRPYTQNYSCGSARDVRERLHQWYQHFLGEQLLAAESTCLDAMITDLFGYHFLQIGGLCDDYSLSDASRIPHRIHMELELRRGSDDTSMFADAAALPIAPESVDMVLLPHVLEFHSNPHEILREVERVLVPEGHIVILAFNPLSLWGLARLMLGWRKRVPWCGTFRTMTRIKDWLQLLGFDITEQKGVFYRPPFPHEKTMQKLAFMEKLTKFDLPIAHATTILVAQKRTVTLTPVKTPWRSPRLVAGTAVEPSTRGMGRRRG